LSSDDDALAWVTGPGTESQMRQAAPDFWAFSVPLTLFPV